MHYKTIVLELFMERKALHEQLRLTGRLLPALEVCAQELRASHQHWIKTLAETNPVSDPIQIESQAMELAVRELQDRLPPVSSAEEEPFSLDAAMAFIRKPTAPG